MTGWICNLLHVGQAPSLQKSYSSPALFNRAWPIWERVLRLTVFWHEPDGKMGHMWEKVNIRKASVTRSPVPPSGFSHGPPQQPPSWPHMKPWSKSLNDICRLDKQMLTSCSNSPPSAFTHLSFSFILISFQLLWNHSFFTVFSWFSLVFV